MTLETVLSSAQEKQAECEKKSWKYKERDGTQIELRQVFSRVVQRLSNFKAIGDSMAAVDPVHLSISWAAISLVLKACAFCLSNAYRIGRLKVASRLQQANRNTIRPYLKGLRLSPAWFHDMLCLNVYTCGQAFLYRIIWKRH